MIFVSMVIDANPDGRDKLIAAMDEMMAHTRTEPGCLVYTYSRDLTDPNRFHLSEIWDSQDLMEEHIDAPHSARFVSVLGNTAKIGSVKAFAGDVAKFRIRAPAAQPRT